MSESRVSDHPLADRRVHALLGLGEAILAAVIGVVYFEGILTWVIVGIGVLNMLVTPYILGQAMESPSETGGVGGD